MEPGSSQVLADAQRLAEQQAEARAAAARFAGAVRERFGDRVRSIRLFGSLARGDWLGPEEADVDISVILAAADEADFKAIIHLGTLELLSSGILISPLVYTPEQYASMESREVLLVREINVQGKLL